MSDNLDQRFIDAVRDRRNAMFRIAMSYLHSYADAEDAVASAIKSTWRHLYQLRNKDAIAPYLMRCTINAAKSELSRRKRVRPADTGPEATTFNEGQLIAEYVSRLPEKYRLPIIMKYGEDMPEKEIAAALRIPRGTVSSRINKALKILRAEMESEVNDGV